MNSSTTSAGTDALADQYNDLRQDVIQMAGDYAASAGSANAYTLNIDDQFDTLTAGVKIKFNANFGNTGAATINVESLGAVSLKKNHDQDLVSGDVESGQIVEAVYDGTNFQIVSPLATAIQGVAGANTEVAVWDSDGRLSSVDTTLSDSAMEINASGSGNRYSIIDFHGDDTYTDFGLRIIRNNTGANAISAIEHRGTGALNIQANEAAPIVFLTTTTERMRLNDTGLGINTNDPQKLLHVKNSSSGFPALFHTKSASANDITGIAFAVANNDTGSGTKGAIIFERLTSSGRGTLHFANNATNDATEVSISDVHMSITMDGDVGIGETSPENLLHISGNNDGIQIETPTSGQQAFLHFAEVGDGDGFTLLAEFSGSGDANQLQIRGGSDGPGSQTVHWNMTRDTGRVAHGQSTTAAEATALYEMSSTSLGFLLPRMTTAQRAAISSPAEALMVYDTDLDIPMYRDASVTEWRGVVQRKKTGDGNFASGATSIVVTGVGFRPRFLRLMCSDSSDNSSMGSSDGTTEGCMEWDISSSQAIVNNSLLGRIGLGGASNWNFQLASFDADGFTITLTETGTGPNIVYFWEAFE